MHSHCITKQWIDHFHSKSLLEMFKANFRISSDLNKSANRTRNIKFSIRSHIINYYAEVILWLMIPDALYSYTVLWYPIMLLVYNFYYSFP